jgi:hypothetical protein
MNHLVLKNMTRLSHQYKIQFEINTDQNFTQLFEINVFTKKIKQP